MKKIATIITVHTAHNIQNALIKKISRYTIKKLNNIPAPESNITTRAGCTLSLLYPINARIKRIGYTKNATKGNGTPNTFEYGLCNTAEHDTSADRSQNDTTPV